MVSRRQTVEDTKDDLFQQYIAKSKERLAELREELKIDRDDLDTELVQQPSLYFKVGQYYAQSISVRDAAKFERDKLHAELDRLIRQEASGSGEKITETQVASRIKENPYYEETQNRYARLCEDAEVWDAMRDSFQQRSYALKDLCALYIAGYYTDSIGRRERNEAINRKSDNVRQRIIESRRGN